MEKNQRNWQGNIACARLVLTAMTRCLLIFGLLTLAAPGRTASGNPSSLMANGSVGGCETMIWS